MLPEVFFSFSTFPVCNGLLIANLNAKLNLARDKMEKNIYKKLLPIPIG
jgi:hypothetical protein